MESEMEKREANGALEAGPVLAQDIDGDWATYCADMYGEGTELYCACISNSAEELCECRGGYAIEGYCACMHPGWEGDSTVKGEKCLCEAQRAEESGEPQEYDPYCYCMADYSVEDDNYCVCVAYNADSYCECIEDTVGFGDYEDYCSCVATALDDPEEYCICESGFNPYYDSPTDARYESAVNYCQCMEGGTSNDEETCACLEMVGYDDYCECKYPDTPGADTYGYCDCVSSYYDSGEADVYCECMAEYADSDFCVCMNDLFDSDDPPYYNPESYCDCMYSECTAEWLSCGGLGSGNTEMVLGDPYDICDRALQGGCITQDDYCICLNLYGAFGTQEEYCACHYDEELDTESGNSYEFCECVAAEETDYDICDCVYPVEHQNNLVNYCECRDTYYDESSCECQYPNHPGTDTVDYCECEYPEKTGKDYCDCLNPGDPASSCECQFDQGSKAFCDCIDPDPETSCDCQCAGSSNPDCKCACLHTDTHSDAFCTCKGLESGTADYCTCIGKTVNTPEHCTCQGLTPGDDDYCACLGLTRGTNDWCDCKHGAGFVAGCMADGKHTLTGDCGCECTDNSPCPNPDMERDPDTCECSGCAEVLTCQNGGQWLDTPDCVCDCTSASCGENGKLDGGETCGCECKNEVVCYNGGVPLPWPDCTCDCSAPSPQYAKSQCTGPGKSWSDDDCSCTCTEGTPCRTPDHNVIGQLKEDCTCFPDCPFEDPCTINGVPGKRDTDCVCVPDCVVGTSCTESDQPGLWKVVNGECVCEICGPSVPCTTAAGVSGHLDNWCTCIADCAYPGTCTATVGTCNNNVPGTWTTSCDCDPDCDPGAEETKAIGNCSEVPCVVQCDCSCLERCTPGEACDMGGGKQGKKDCNCDCYCRKPGEVIPCTLGTEGGELDENCDCKCYKEGQSCTKGRGVGVVDASCDCVCANESVLATTCESEESGGTWDGTNCECTCPEGKHLGDDGACHCDNEEAKKTACELTGGEWDPAECACECDSEKGLYLKADGTCGCLNETSERPACESLAPNKEWLGAPQCKCACTDEENRKKECEETGVEFWDDNHTWNGTNCTCDCNDAHENRCDTNYGSWSHENCGCVCDERQRTCEDDTHYFKEDPYCECKCKDEVAEQLCKADPTPGTWNVESCSCTCPPGSTLISGSCKCDDEETKKSECERDHGAGAWKPATCACCQDENGDKEKCEEAGPADKGWKKGTWKDTTCKCECPSPTVWTESGCICDTAAVSKCPSGLFNYSTCECDCDAYGPKRELHELCSTTQAKNSGAKWDKDTCECVCKDANKTLQDGVCACANTADKTACDKMAEKLPTYEWDPDTCKCDCGDAYKNGTTPCVLDNGGKGKYVDCKCECDKEQDCGRADFKLNEGTCLCRCVEEDKKCKTHANVDDEDGKKNRNCECICDDEGGECWLIANKANGDSADGRKDKNCDCKCTSFGQPCDFNGKGPGSGKVWTDCKCVCNDFGAYCDNPTNAKPGTVGAVGTIQLNAKGDCECLCADDGLPCVLPGGGTGWTKDCECVCDEAKLSQECDERVKTNPDSGWVWDSAACDCRCTWTEAACQIMKMTLDTNTCTCEKCDTDGSKEAACEKKAEETGGAWVWNPTACTCDCNESEATCGTRNLKFVPNDCICKDCTNEKVQECKTKHMRLGADCECEACDPSEHAPCVSPAQPDENCDCFCDEAILGPCPDGKYRKPELGCECVCDNQTCGGENDPQHTLSDNCECLCNVGYVLTSARAIDPSFCLKGSIDEHDTACTCKCDDPVFSDQDVADAYCKRAFGEFFSANMQACECECSLQSGCMSGKKRNPETCACECNEGLDALHRRCDKASSNGVQYRTADEENCDCKCLLSDASCADAPWNMEHAHRDADCNCVCNTVTCDPALEETDTEHCKCKCKSTLQPCTFTDANGTTTTIPRDKNCECDCSDDGSCGDKATFQKDYDEANKRYKCYCKCTDYVVSECDIKREKTGGAWKLDEGTCNCFCNKTNDDCVKEGESAGKKMRLDPNTCTCVCDEACGDDPAKPDLDKEECTCWCDEEKRGKDTCKSSDGKSKWDAKNCKCPCDPEASKPSDYKDRSACYTYDWNTCSWKEENTSWAASYDAWQADVAARMAAIASTLADIRAVTGEGGGDNLIPNPPECAVGKADSNCKYVRTTRQNAHCNIEDIKKDSDDILDYDHALEEAAAAGDGLKCAAEMPQIPAAPEAAISDANAKIQALAARIGILENIDAARALCTDDQDLSAVCGGELKECK